MRPLVWPVLLLAVTMLAGCVSEDGPDPTPDAGAAEEAPLRLQRLEWDGHIVHSALDPPAHMKDPEGVLFPVQQAGFLVEIAEVPAAIEVMVSWSGDAGFYLHPHYTAEHDPAPGGDTLYYGYFSELFETSPGCVRVPAADMAAGLWPMMIHPRSGTMDVDYTITVGIVNATGVLLDDMHGHRTLGDSPVEDHGVEPCSLLV